MQALGTDKVAFTEGFGRYRLDYRRLQFSAVRSLSTSILAGKQDLRLLTVGCLASRGEEVTVTFQASLFGEVCLLCLVILPC